MKNKILLAIADGVGDRPCESLGYKTPLEYAKTPNLDKIITNGTGGIMDLYAPGIPVGTDLGHMLMFGYDKSLYPKRGPIEAFGEGLKLIEGDVAFRCNFATVDDDMVIVDRRANRIRNGTKELAQALNGLMVDNVEVIFKEACEHRAILVLRGKGLSDKVSDSDPKKEGLKIKEVLPLDESDEAKFTAQILNKVIIKARDILSKHHINEERIKFKLNPANIIITRGAGKMPNIEPISKKMGYKACMVAAESTVIGVARMAGFDIFSDESLTGNIDTNIDKKAQLALNALRDYDFIAVHFKATDLMGHDNNPKGKVEAIELYDEMVGKIYNSYKEYTNDDVIFALAADHSTPCERKEHSGDPVPVAISGINIRKDSLTSYNEITCANGGLNRITGKDFNNILLDYLEVTKKEGN